MRKLILTAVLAIGPFMMASAQKPTTTYPYLYPQFTDGRVVMETGNMDEKKLNIHLRADKLHYIDNDIIKEAFLNDVKAVEIGNDIFIPVFGRMMKVIAKNDNGCVAAEILGDFEAAREAKGAYGTSSTSSSTMKLTSLQTDTQVNQNYMNIFNEKEQGMELRVRTTYYLITPKFKVKANKKDVDTSLPAYAATDYKSFLKSHKVKWSDPQSLLTVVDFLNNY
ncbi:MAG: hypothetical protein Q4A02_01495 [Bacteroidales bacterium]|nr:hypothetical protein [Bacteroidales bacterium]